MRRPGGTEGLGSPDGATRAGSLLRIAHLIVGVGGFLAFGQTGLFMDQRLDHLVGMADGPRALYRSGHIYLLFAALVHTVLGLYLRSATTRPGRVAQWLGSALLFAAVGCFLYGFYVETPLAVVERPWVRTGIYLTAAGVLLHAIAVLVLRWLPGLGGRLTQ